MQQCVRATIHASMCVCVGGNCILRDLLQKDAWKLVSANVLFTLWGVRFCFCYWSQMYNSVTTP